MTNQPPEAKLGKGMLAAGWLVLLGLLTLYFGQWLDRRENPNHRPQTRAEGGIHQVILERNHQHHYVMTGRINGREVTFLVDTGATTVSVPEHMAARLNLQPGAAQWAQTANGMVETRLTTISELSLGSITLYNVRANINPGMQQNSVLLGMSALKDIEFTHRDGTLTLRQYH